MYFFCLGLLSFSVTETYDESFFESLLLTEFLSRPMVEDMVDWLVIEAASTSFTSLTCFDCSVGFILEAGWKSVGGC